MKILVLLSSIVCLCSCSANNKKPEAEASQPVQSTPAIETTQTKKEAITMSGILAIGHETRTFKPGNSDTEYWIIDETGSLYDKYDEITNGKKNGKPVIATLTVVYEGKRTEGFAANYPGVYTVKKVVSMKLPEQKRD